MALKDPNYSNVPPAVAMMMRTWLPELRVHLGSTGGNFISHSLATAANDFLVASGAGVFVKKTLTETRAVLGLEGAAYLNVGTTAGTVAAGDHAHAGVYDPAGTATGAVSAHAGAGDPHTGYLLADGTRALTGDWDAGDQVIRAGGLGVRNAAGALRYCWVYNAALNTMDLEYTP